MDEDHDDGSRVAGKSALGSVGLFWGGYLVITLVAGYATSMFFSTEVWQLTAWGFVSALGLLALPRLLKVGGAESRVTLRNAFRIPALGSLSIGLLIGTASFCLHVIIIDTFGGSLRFERVADVGAIVALIYFARFMATSCMEEIGFRGFALGQLSAKLGVGPAVCITSVVFGLSHLSYGWELETILMGVIPCGLLWGMSAIATRGLAVPIGLHAAWNFAGWSAGSRAEIGLFRMVIEDDAVARAQQVGTISYLSIFGALTLAFWAVHRRNLQQQS